MDTQLASPGVSFRWSGSRSRYRVNCWYTSGSGEHR
jgi:hypothetical protein